MKMENLREWYNFSEVAMTMLLVQLIATGLQLLSRFILHQGTFIYALMAYRHVVAALFVAPFTYFERKEGSKLSRSVCFWLLSSSTGITLAMGLFYYGLKDTTATYATNFLNIIPVVTFIFSIIAGFEKLSWRLKSGKIKITGTLICVGGALIVSLYEGKTFHISHLNLKHFTMSGKNNLSWTRGSLFLVGCCLSYALWFIIHMKLLTKYPFKYTITMLTCFIVAVESAIVGLCIDRRVEAWMQNTTTELITILYSGVLATAVTFCLISRAVARNGPTYPSMFNPLTLIFVTFFEALLFGEVLSVGSLLGMCFIIMGLYAFLWGRRKESEIAQTLILKIIPKSVDLQSPATIMPIIFPPNDSIIILKDDEKLDEESHA